MNKLMWKVGLISRPFFHPPKNVQNYDPEYLPFKEFYEKSKFAVFKVRVKIEGVPYLSGLG